MKRVKPVFNDSRFVIALTFILILYFGTISLAQLSDSLCSTHKNCADCIQSKDGCAWCQKPDFSPGNRTSTKCNSKSFYDNLPEGSRCDGENLIYPENDIILEEDGDKPISSRADPIVQIRPQQISLKLRVGQPQDIKIQFAQAVNYPVDLYYLMDLSYSMKDDKDNLIKFGQELAKQMTNVTSKFQIGFGSFVDKVVMPFVSTVEQKLQRPCGNDETCAPPYSFRNHLKLTSEFSRFTEEVKNSKVSGNLDAPEGGFDGIVQVAVCEDQIGWRKEARKFIVFATDASFHFAGDGKLGGIVKPNDGLCHLDYTGAYTHAEILDYPSIAQINSVVKNKVINVIFAVTSDQVPIYTSLRGSIEGSAVGLLTSDSSNVVQLVTDEYRKIASSIEMKSTAGEEIGVSFYTNCGQSTDASKKNRCTGIPIGTIVEFTAKIEAMKCPTNPADWNQQFTIYSVGVAERITVNLEFICGCEECENLEIPKSEKCNYNGTLSCGICRCDKTYFGEMCQCSDKSGKNRDDEEWRCRKGNSTDVCSKRGNCFCGQCECERRDDPKEIISGPFCECDNFSCDRNDRQLCSGPEHGECVCGKCQCSSKWSGSACECTKDESTCYKPGDTEKCSGRGECECGKCKCQSSGNETYTGNFCEHCRNCGDECNELAECVRCKVHKTGNLDRCSQLCLRFAKIEEFDFVYDNGTTNEKYCLFTDPADGCRFPFIYGYTPTREINVRAQTTKDCPPEAPVALIIGGGTGTIVLVGLLSLILWKIFTTIHDRREYARFEKDAENSKFSSEMNPLYKQATTTFQNPIYDTKDN